MDWAIYQPRIRFDVALNAKNVSGYSGIPQERCKIEWRGAGTLTEHDRMLSPSGKKSIKRKRKSADCCIRQEF